MAVRRCPQCGTVNRPTVPACECGYLFDAVQAQALGMIGKPARRGKHDAGDLSQESPEDQRHYHVHRLTMGWFTIVGFVVLCLACLALLVFGSPIMAFPAAGSIALLVKGTRMVGTSRRALRALDDHDAKLPKARLLWR